MAGLQQRVAAVRRFNRFYTRQLGVLRKTFLDSPYSLGEARLLYEIAHRRTATASEIGRALDLDAGYLSRALRNFEKRGLIQRKVSSERCASKPSDAVGGGTKSVRAAGAPFAARRRGDARAAQTGRSGPAGRRHAHDRDAARRRCRSHGSAGTSYRASRACAGRFRLDRQTPRRALRGGIRLGCAVRRRLRADRRGLRQQIGSGARALLDCGDRRRECRLDHAGEEIRKTSRASGFCWSIRPRADWASARGWPTNASASRAERVTAGSRYGRTAC